MVIADGVAGAERTLDWLNSVDAWLVDGRPVPLEPWVARVRDLCDQVIHPERRKEHGATSRALLGWVVGDAALADHALANGVKALSTDSAASAGQLARLLFETARRPVTEGTVVEEAPRWSIFARTASGWDVRSPSTR
jgi:hypothetical protein